MAALLFERELGRRGVEATVSSAGLLLEDQPAERNALRVLADRGLDGSTHRSRVMTRAMVEQADLIVVGTVAQLVYMVPAFRREGPFPISFDWRGPRVRQVLVLMLPVTIGLGLININLSVDTIFATLVSDQAPRAIDAGLGHAPWLWAALTLGAVVAFYSERRPKPRLG